VREPDKNYYGQEIMIFPKKNKNYDIGYFVWIWWYFYITI